MKRLIEEENHPGTPEYRLTALVRATKPFKPTPFRKPRIFARLSSAAPRKRARVRGAVATLLLLSAAATAAAALEHSWTLQREVHIALPIALGVPSTAIEIAAARTSAATTPSANSMATNDNVSPAIASAIAQAVKTPPGADAHSENRPRLKGGEDPAKVLEAIRALRSQRDPTRAAALLASYLKDHPNSVLAEDALALSIEAADARHDARASADLARRYLKQFPSGRFRAVAVKAVERGDP